ncbi:MAG: hypothetical protein WBY94_13430 [Polyangiaceae bacterium]
MSRRLLLALLCFANAGAIGCSSSESGTLELVTGLEPDTFSRAPAPVELKVESVNSAGQKQTLATASLPATQVDLGSVDQSAEGTLQVTGLDANGDPVVYGQSLPIQFGSLDGVAPLPVFVQRMGEFARMPAPLSDDRTAPTLAHVGGRYRFIGGGVSGGDSSVSDTAQIYDFAYYAPLSPPPSLPRAPESVVWVGTVAWLIDQTGATSFDLSQGTKADVTAPAGGSFGAVAGGATVVATDGTQYVVGATRATGNPTQTVLEIDPTGSASWATLSAARLGAAATWVVGRGLVVAGGSAQAAGVEIIAPGATNGAALAYPPDPSIGSGAAALDGQHILLAGGTTAEGLGATVRSIDLACSMQCAPTPWAALPETPALAPAQVFASDSAHALLIGDDASGMTHAFRLTATAADGGVVGSGAVTEILTKAKHTGGRAIVSPLGSVVLFGGTGEIESFVP